MDEFRIIDTIFKPLANQGAPAFGLASDTAIYSPPEGYDLVITKDAMIEGVHFLEDEDPGVIARRLLRSNLSDLAASGAQPIGYLLALMGEKKLSDQWLKAFAAALKEDQQYFDITLFGGDTTSGSKSLCLSLTALGLVKKGQGLSRLGAKAGDLLCVSGTIGDAHLGLKCLKGEMPLDDYLVARFQTPMPRLDLGQTLIGLASATADVSDGLIADARHIAQSSGVGATIYLYDVPLSDSGIDYAKGNDTKILELATAGDDFELVFTVSPKHREVLEVLSAETGLPISVIGEITAGKEFKVLDKFDRVVKVPVSGYRHFRE